MRCFVASSFGLALLVAVGGCRSCDRVESELRGRENEVRELRDELDRTSIYNQTLQQELRSLRGELGVGPDGRTPAAYPVQSVALGRQTGGRSNSDGPGDDALQVQLEPKDPEGHAIKVPGQLLVQVQEVTKEGVKRPLSAWEVPAEQMRRSLRSGLLTTGYVVNLPWKVWPSTEKLRVTAQFQLADGRLFEADKDITVRLVPVNKRPVFVPEPKPEPSPPPKPPAGSADSPNLLPSPQKKEPNKSGSTPAPDATPGPFLGASRVKTPGNVWYAVDPPLAPPTTEILRPVPLKNPGS